MRRYARGCWDWWLREAARACTVVVAAPTGRPGHLSPAGLRPSLVGLGVARGRRGPVGCLVDRSGPFSRLALLAKIDAAIAALRTASRRSPHGPSGSAARHC